MIDKKKYMLAGIELESPFMNAGGSLHGLNEKYLFNKVEDLARSRIGAIVLGSFTVLRRSGNVSDFGEPTYYHDHARGLTYNCKGLPNPGLKRILEMAPEFNALAGNKPVIYSGSITFATPDIGNGATQISRQACDYFEKAKAKIVEVDAGCPHILRKTGERMPIVGYDIGVLEEVVEALQKTVGKGQKLGIKMPPFLTEQDLLLMPKVAHLLKRSGVFAYIATSNTIPDQIARDLHGKPILSSPGGKGGMSGPAVKEVGRQQLQLWRKLLGDEFEIISTLGVDSGKEVAERLKMGANLTAATTLFIESKNWTATAESVLQEYEAYTRWE